MTAGAALLLILLQSPGVIATPATGSSAAIPASSAGGPLVLEVLVDAGLTDRHLGAALVEQLRAELAAAQVVVLAPGAAASPAANARLTVGPVRDQPRALSLEIQYLRSATAVHRVLDLSALPADGALLGIAVAVDELLRTSWSLGVVGAAPARPPAPASLATSPASRPRAPSAEARLLLAGERQRGGVITLGPELVLVLPLGARVAVDVRGGWRGGASRQVTDGTVDSTAVLAGGGISLALPAAVDEHRAGAELALHLDAAWLRLRGTASSSATGHQANALGLAAVGGVGAWVTLAPPLRLVLFAGWQLPLRSVTALNGSRAVGSVFHPGFCAAAGIGARF